MSTVLVVDEELANEIKALTKGVYIVHREDDIAGPVPIEWATEGLAQIVLTVEQAAPDALVVDLTFGGNRYEPIDAVGVLLRGQYRSPNPPATVLIAPAEPPDLRAYARMLGCHSIIDVSVVGRASLAQEVIARVRKAKAWRRGDGAWPLDATLPLPLLSPLRCVLPRSDLAPPRPQVSDAPRPRRKRMRGG